MKILIKKYMYNIMLCTPYVSITPHSCIEYTVHFQYKCKNSFILLLVTNYTSKIRFETRLLSIYVANDNNNKKTAHYHWYMTGLYFSILPWRRHLRLLYIFIFDVYCTMYIYTNIKIVNFIYICIYLFYLLIYNDTHIHNKNNFVLVRKSIS